MTVADLLEVLERLAPAELAEEWDNVGLLVGRRDQVATGVLVALDLREAVLDEAVARKCDVVVTHHPVIFPSITAVSDATATGRLILRAVELGIAVVSVHTNLDSARDGLNDQMADMLGLTGLVPLRSATPDSALGLGRVGRAPAGATLRDLVNAIGIAFEHAPRTFVGDPDQLVETVALCTGSGASLIGEAITAGADVYVTGDLKYHDCDRAPGLALVSLPHGWAERITLRAWTELLEREVAPSLPVHFADTDTDPWQVVG